MVIFWWVMKRIFIVVAQRTFRDSEYIVPRAFWEQYGAEILRFVQKTH